MRVTPTPQARMLVISSVRAIECSASRVPINTAGGSAMTRTEGVRSKP